MTSLNSPSSECSEDEMEGLEVVPTSHGIETESGRGTQQPTPTVEGVLRAIFAAGRQPNPAGLCPMFIHAQNKEDALEGLAYIYQQIIGTKTYRPNIGQTNAASSSLLWAMRALCETDAKGWQLVDSETPSEQTLIVWGAGGIRFMRKDDMGQWRNMMHAPKRPPTHWRPMPDSPHLQDNANG